MKISDNNNLELPIFYEYYVNDKLSTLTLVEEQNLILNSTVQFLVIEYMLKNNHYFLDKVIMRAQIVILSYNKYPITISTYIYFKLKIQYAQILT